ncbi:helix-hairpin-helix domain-containing protein [Shouchella sp. 1P09AA]|uniref:helix-hairpin-helix domain-containing protein n=1 Tax=unclassified Shouchella TaxID=2893065 RepID=UPI0039A0C724
MDVVFILFLLISFFAVVLGTIKPKLIRFPSRKRVLAYGLPSMFIFMFLAGATLDSDDEPIASASSTNEEVLQLEETIEERDAELEDLKKEVEELNLELEKAEEEFTQEDIDQLKDEWEEEFNSNFEKEFKEDLEKEIKSEYEDKISSLNEQITEKDDSLSDNEAMITKLESEVSTFKDELETAKSETVSASTSESSSEESNHSCPAGSIHINTASESELQGIYEIGPDRASQIMQLRPFASYNDMKRISGIGDARAQAIEAQGMVCFD